MMLNTKQVLQFGAAVNKSNLLPGKDYKIFVRKDQTTILCFTKEARDLIFKINEGESK